MTTHGDGRVLDTRAFGRREFLRDGGLAAVLGVGVISGIARPAAASILSGPESEEDCITTENLGSGAVAFPVIGGALVGGKALAGSRNILPPRVAVYDVATSAVTRNVTIPTGNFVQAIAPATDREAYIGVTSAPGSTNLYHYDIDSDVLTGVAALDLSFRNVTVAPDGVVFAGGEPSRVYSFDPETQRVEELPRPDSAAQSTYSVAATDSTVFVGSGNFTSGGTIPKLTAIDRVTGEMQSILPPELANAKLVFSMRVAGDKLLVGTYDLVEAAFAVIDLDDYSRYGVVHLPGQNIVDGVERVGDGAYFTTRYSGNLWRYDLATGEATEIPGPQAGIPHWHVSLLDDRLVGITLNSVWTYDPSTGESEVVNLVNAGAHALPQQMQSIAARDGKVMVAANWIVGVRDIATGQLRSFNVPGEAKDMIFIGDVLYLAMYTVAEIWTYDPQSDTAALAAKMPRDQNRPNAMDYDGSLDFVLVATGSDFTGGGALVVFDRGSGSVAAYENPLGPGQRVTAVAALDGTAIIAGANGDFAAFDPTDGRELWRLDRFADDPVTGLATHRGSVYGMTGGGVIFTLRVDGRIWAENRSGGLGGTGRLFASPRAGLYGATRSRLFAIDFRTCEAHVIVDDLNSQAFGAPDLSIDERDAIYVLKEFDALRVTVQPC